MKKMSYITEFDEAISVVDGCFYLKAPEEAGISYAFYIEYKSEIERRWYKKDSSYRSVTKINPGIYDITFFYKRNDNIDFKKYKFFYNEKKGLISVDVDVLEEVKDYKIDFYDIKSDITFIVFNAAGSHKRSKAFGLDYLLSEGYNVVACYQDHENFYQGLDLFRFSDIVTPYLKNKKVYLYGSSLGGYCALYYGGVIEGTIIAAAPRNPLHPIMQSLEVVKMDKSYVHSEISDNIKTSNKVYIFLDPKVRKDVIFFEACVKKAYPNLYLFELPYTGHAVLYHLIKTRQLKNILKNIVNAKPVIIEDIDSEFTTYGRALDSYRNLAFNIKKLHNNDDVHPLIMKRLKELLKLTESLGQLE